MTLRQGFYARQADVLESHIPMRKLPTEVQRHVKLRLDAMAEKQKMLTRFDLDLVSTNPAPEGITDAWSWRATRPVSRGLQIPRFGLECDLVVRAYPTRDLTYVDVGDLVRLLRVYCKTKNLIDFVGKEGLTKLAEVIRSNISRIAMPTRIASINKKYQRIATGEDALPANIKWEKAEFSYYFDFNTFEFGKLRVIFNDTGRKPYINVFSMEGKDKAARTHVYVPQNAYEDRPTTDDAEAALRKEWPKVCAELRKYRKTAAPVLKTVSGFTYTQGVLGLYFYKDKTVYHVAKGIVKKANTTKASDMYSPEYWNEHFPKSLRTLGKNVPTVAKAQELVSEHDMRYK